MESLAPDQSPAAPPADAGRTGSAPETGAAPPADALAELKSQLDAVTAKAAEYLDGWQRSRAEFANYKKRIERENADLSSAIAATVLTRILPVLDDFDLAMKNVPAEGDGTPWASGLALVHKKFVSVLENEGIRRIDAEGQSFDPNLHEAVVHQDSPEHDSGQVVEVLRHGYKLGDRVLRPALVKVAK